MKVYRRARVSQRFKMISLGKILESCRIIPVVTIRNIEDAVPLAEAIFEGGLPTIEVTLRTPEAFAALEVMAKHFPKFSIGVGTVIENMDIRRAKESGAAFAVSPGINIDLIEKASAEKLPYLPGIQTSSEALLGLRLGIKFLKFFPAKIAGGLEGLKQIAPVYPELMFCPTGGISFDEAPEYLAQKNVISVGGSFASPQTLIAERDWNAIKALAQRAAKL